MRIALCSLPKERAKAKAKEKAKAKARVKAREKARVKVKVKVFSGAGAESMRSAIPGATGLADAALRSTTSPELDVVRANLAWVHDDGQHPRLRFADGTDFQP